MCELRKQTRSVCSEHVLCFLSGYTDWDVRVWGFQKAIFHLSLVRYEDPMEGYLGPPEPLLEGGTFLATCCRRRSPTVGDQQAQKHANRHFHVEVCRSSQRVVKSALSASCAPTCSQKRWRDLHVDRRGYFGGSICNECELCIKYRFINKFMIRKNWILILLKENLEITKWKSIFRIWCYCNQKRWTTVRI